MWDATADHATAGTEGSITEVGSQVKIISCTMLARACAEAEF